MGILRKFLYVDDNQLNQYISQVEDGLRSVANRSDSDSRSRGAGVDLKLLTGSGKRENNSSVAESYDDNSASRFERLLQLVDGHHEEFGWKEFDLDNEDGGSQFSDLKVGHIISCAAELYESDVTAVSRHQVNCSGPPDGRASLEASPLIETPVRAIGSGLCGSERPFSRGAGRPDTVRASGCGSRRR